MDSMFFAEHEADAHQRELRKLAATRPRPIAKPGPVRESLGRALITWGLRLSMPRQRTVAL